MARVQVLTSSKEQRWVTPPALVEAAQRWMGLSIGLDAAALADTARVPSYLGPDHPDPDRRDALGDVSWSAWITHDEAWWLNPPYGGGLRRWVARAAAEGRYRAGCAFVHANTDTDYFSTCWHTAEEILFLKGRVTFLDPDTQEPAPAGTTGGHMLVIWRPAARARRERRQPPRVWLVDHRLRPI